MAIGGIGVGTRGATWLAELSTSTEGDNALPSTSVRPCFASDVDNQGRYGASLKPSSQPLLVFPASRPAQYVTESQSSAFSGSNLWIPGDLTAVSKDVIHRVMQDPESSARTLRSDSKIVAAPYESQSSAVLILSVGGPNENALFISILEPPLTADFGLCEDTNSVRHQIPAGLRTSAVPCYVSPSPITSLKLATSQPQITSSRAHEGPWLAIQTLTGTHIAAVHRTCHRRRKKVQSTLPEFILTHICSFLTHRVSKLREHQTGIKQQGLIFPLGAHPVADVAWDPRRRTAALVVDTAGNAWRWSVDLLSSDARWLTHGQYLEKIFATPLTEREAYANHNCMLHWVDDLSTDRAFLITDHTIFGLRFHGKAEAAQRLFEAPLSPTHLRPSPFLHAINAGIPIPTSLGSHTFNGEPLLLVVSSAVIHVLDAVNPRRELLAIQHHRNFDDETLRLSLVNPSLHRADESHRARLLITLTSDRDSTATLYTILCATTTSADARRQVVRAWQACSPAEVPRQYEGQTGMDLMFVAWEGILPNAGEWRRWCRINRKALGSYLQLQRSGDGAVWMQAFDERKGASTEKSDLPINLYATSSVRALETIIQAWTGIKNSAQPRLSSVTYEPRDVKLYDLSRVHLAFNRFFDLENQWSTGSSLRNYIGAIERFRQAMADVTEPTIMTALDLLALSSFNGSEFRHSVPLLDRRGAVSALYVPQTLLNLGPFGQVIDTLMGTVSRQLNAARVEGSAWWDGERWPMELLLPMAHAQWDDSEDLDESHYDQQDLKAWARQVEALANRYIGSSAHGSPRFASRIVKASISQIVLQLALCNEVWSPRPVTVEAAKGFLSSQAQNEAIGSQRSGLSQPEPWSESIQHSFQRASKRSRRKESISSQETTSASTKRRRRDSVNNADDHGETADRNDMLAGNLSRLAGQDFHGSVDMDAETDGMDVYALARRQLPEPEEVHLSFFAPSEHIGGGSVTTRAARLLLSSWPLTSIDPCSAENDPAYYTYSNHYTLLDAAKTSAEGSYTSASALSGADGESTGWSSAWTSETTNWNTSGETSDGTAFSRGHSVWGRPAPGHSVSLVPSSQPNPAGSGIRESMPQSQSRPLFGFEGGDTAELHRRWHLAPPSVASSSQRAFIASGSSRSAAVSAYSQRIDTRTSFSQQTTSVTPPSLASQQGMQPSQQASPPTALATQPVAGPHTSRRQDFGGSDAIPGVKKLKKRMGGF